ncbi:UDP-N-acetylglucosamine transferase subunit ALG13 [Breznakia sp. PF5-3]|uniref:PssE/Cps14G family polysaccharide biosynthesis glycosyltransferase n=1 Tax=unclassified Breznakia TaxID=2623764 RepID=UPI00240610BF|nr:MULTISPECIES: PssE/Cps14G family polysaccharide biosynthesis glycosyltransferase [unclassified Breznakia]MDF9824974.1 UDP-N-acetylglucosamine transferase subunit ALG13 [Breznakia sp. PM6-1]MDF9835833.1 UDP-N-acetylglucosamine transferase subunit ALG13 [Breznakia sp. PF5-3]MDF9836915.1 UDP-N-acetylglucosamine transferase subunit ALG13 [Breznakia sp. PFB2-8]MDF9859861.1 UDP-N-acetylglucosamine transferase subunit ALG13 [Breznakia sp. PH5-24]
MIFVTLGTQDKSFVRLLKEIDKLIDDGIINDEVVVQSGYTKYNSKNMKILDFIPFDEFNTYLEKSNYIITHGGVGSILTSITMDKKVIAVSRLKEFNEHENNHQVEIVSRFNDMRYILGCLQVKDINDAVLKIESFVPQPYRSNNEQFCNQIAEEIDKR